MSATATMDEFEALLNESFERKTPEEGTVVKGIVIAVENGQAIIDVGFKVEGRVDIKEFAAPGKPAEIVVGDEVEVFLDRVENARGEDATLAQVLADLRSRDARDAGRDAAPMRQAEDSHLLDTTELAIDAAVDEATRIIEQALDRARKQTPG